MPALSFINRIADSVYTAGVTAVGLALVLAGCHEGTARHPTEVLEVTAATPAAPEGSIDAAGAELSTLDLSLPFDGTVSNSGFAFHVKQTGDGHGGWFENINSSSIGHALIAVTTGHGSGMLAQNVGRGRGALISADNLANVRPALEVRSSSRGGGQSGTGLDEGQVTQAAALDVRAHNPNAIAPAAYIQNRGKGAALKLNHEGSSGAIVTFQSGGVNKARISKSGKGFFNGGTQTGGADLAEAFAVEGRVKAYEAGDVLTISRTSDRTVEKGIEPYSTRVIGVYATKPGVLLTERDIDASIDDMIPLGVVGVIPTKVSAENGAIHRGDLLVTAPSPGYAMLGTDHNRMLGAVIGKALEEFSGPGRGVIRVFVNVR